MQAILTHKEQRHPYNIELLLELLSRDSSAVKDTEVMPFLEVIWDEAAESSDLHPVFKELIQEAIESVGLALEAGRTAQEPLRFLGRLYRSGGDYFALKDSWNRRLKQLSQTDLESNSWRDLKRALTAARRGEDSRVLEWVERMEQNFLQYLDRYEAYRILPDEVTAEAALCHHYLTQGVECWLEALCQLAEGLDGDIDGERVLKLAKEGQRYLTGVRMLSRELKQNTQRLVGG